MKRVLDERLYLVVKQGLQGLPSEWQFPHAQHQGQESIRCGGLHELHHLADHRSNKSV
jgi:hypothetical protein